MKTVTLTGTWEDMHVEAEVVYGDRMGDPEVAMTEIGPYCEELRVYAPSGDDIAGYLLDFVQGKIADKLIEEAKE